MSCKYCEHIQNSLPRKSKVTFEKKAHVQCSFDAHLKRIKYSWKMRNGNTFHMRIICAFITRILVTNFVVSMNAAQMPFKCVSLMQKRF